MRALPVLLRTSRPSFPRRHLGKPPLPPARASLTGASAIVLKALKKCWLLCYSLPDPRDITVA
eukprot:6173571-Pleurochrysis_carterae.AAC.2